MNPVIIKNIFLALTNKIIANELKKSFLDMGIINVLQFSSCKKLIEYVFCAKPTPDLIISQTFSYDEIDGFDAANFIWQKYNVPIIFLASPEISKTKYRWVSDKCRIISIPFDMNTLLNLVRRFLNIPGKNPDGISNRMHN